jgi:glutamate dehydrogenase (NAD(P)+)
MRPLLDTIWVTAGDLGTPQARLDAVFARAGLGASSLHAALLRSAEPSATVARVQQLFAEGDHGLRMPDLIGGYGVAEASLAGLGGLGLAPSESRAVVQGFGAMGGSSALYLHLAGVRVVCVSDALGVIINPGRGLDVPALLAARSSGGIIDRAVLRGDDEQRPGESWLDVDAELLVPAAVSYAISEKNCDSVRARLITEAANVPITNAAERRLLDRGVVVIPDFVANAGAAAWAWWAIFGLVSDPESSRSLLSRHVRPLVDSLIRAWTTDGVSPRDGARIIAEERLHELGEQFGRITEMVPLFEAGLQSAASLPRPDDRQRPTATIT